MSGVLGGLRAWLLQRVTSVYVAVFLIYILVYLALNGDGMGYAGWRDWVGHPLMLLATALFFLALLLHAWIGLRDVVLDYVKPLALRLTVLALMALALVACGVWAGTVLLITALR